VLDADGRSIQELSSAGAATLRARGIVEGGMIPKVQAALDAAATVSLVKIAPAGGQDAVLAALESHVGTRLVGNENGATFDG
jgi:acetylglutamate kinase